MATITTVHGTFASGPEEGNRWWQIGSEFEQHIRQLVEAENGKLDWKPLIWDGNNSETSRRDAANKLYNRIKNFERNEEDYCLIGHSHGGSVISGALMRCADKKRPLKKLGKWITAGTPFIVFNKEKLLFTRLNLFQKTLYIALIAFASLFVIGMAEAFGVVESIANLITQDFNLELLAAISVFIAVAFVPFAIIYFILWYLNTKSLYMYNRKSKTIAMNEFRRLWVPLWHTQDEAIHGLQSIKNVKFEIFKSDFATPMLLFLSIFVLPIILISLSLSDITREDIRNYLGLGGPGFLGYFLSPETSMTYLFIDAIPEKLGLGGADDWKWLAYTLVGVPLLFISISLLIVLITKFIAKYVSPFLSWFLNKITWEQIRAILMGGDTDGEYATDAQCHPVWVSAPCPSLPATLSDEILACSNDAAMQALPKFRNALNQLAFSEEMENKSDVVSNYLTWEELVHTNYFNVPRFRKLVAYAITQANGFKATDTFKNDPDYELVAKWYEELKPKPVDAV